MSDAWGGSFGTPSAWGVSWGSAAPAPAAATGGHFVPTKEELARARQRDRKAERARQREWDERLTDLRQLRAELRGEVAPVETPAIRGESSEAVYAAELGELRTALDANQREVAALKDRAELARRQALLDYARGRLAEMAARVVAEDEETIELLLLSL